MHPVHTLQTRCFPQLPRLSLTVLLALCASVLLPAQTSTPTEDEETLVLSPFVVDASAEDGYRATQSLNGTRLKSDLRDVAASMTIFTEELMDDLGAISIDSLLEFAPNTDVFIDSVTDTGGNGDGFINQDTTYVTRGNATTLISQDFFQTGLPNDRFNSESLTFTRGPNAILFGLGNSAGAFVSSTKRAQLQRDRNRLTTVVDHRGSNRFNLDLNKVIVKGKLALRYSGLYDVSKHYLSPAEGLSRRHFITLTAQPWKKTTVRVNYEKGNINRPAVRPWPIYDNIIPWFDAGMPTLPLTTSSRNVRGIENDGGNNLIVTSFSPAGTVVPTMNWRNTGRSAAPTFANGYVVAGSNLRDFLDESYFPSDVTPFGNSAFRYHDYVTKSFFIEQQITDRFFIEAALNKSDNEEFGFNGANGSNNRLYADVNQRLPNGSGPNPNVGRAYIQVRPTVIDRPSQRENKRVMASYDLDFTQHKGWTKHFGRHQIAAFYESYNFTSVSSNNILKNFDAAGNHTGVQVRFYQDAAAGQVGASRLSEIASVPNIYADSTYPVPDQNGDALGFVAQQGPFKSVEDVTTKAFAMQSYFFDRRLVLTNGFRTDSQDARNGSFTDYRPLAVNGININPRSITKDELPVERSGSGDTRTFGVAFHVTNNISLLYNKSNNFNVNSGQRDIYGNLTPNPTGEGEDFSLRLNLLDRKLQFDVTYYKNDTVNLADDVRNTPVGSFNDISLAWRAIADFEDAKEEALKGLPEGTGTAGELYRTPPYATTNQVWVDVATVGSDGWEFSVTARPVKGWNISLNGSKRGQSSTTERAPIVQEYLKNFLFPQVAANPEWNNGVTINGTFLIPEISGNPLSFYIAELKQLEVDFQRISNLPGDIFAPNWSLNLVNSYRFQDDSRLKGFSIGGTMKARGKTLTGFGTDTSDVVIADIQYFTGNFVEFGMFMGYRRKIMNGKVDWNVQLNIRNLLDQNTIYPRRDVDTRDGSHTPFTVLSVYREPRTFQLTNTFTF